MRLKKANFSTCVLIVILLLSSCQSESGIIATIESTDTVATVTQPKLELATTLTPLPTANQIVETALAPSPTASVTRDSETMTLPSPLATPTVIAATSTPLPTLEGKELDIAITELLENPMNCDSPCWWGAVPGVTTFNDIKHTLSHYNLDIIEYYDDEDEPVRLKIRIGPIIEQSGYETTVGYFFSDTILKSVTVYYSQSISEILIKYGQPDEVYVETGITFAPMSLRLNLVYLQEGMGFGFVADSIQKNHKIEGCFVDELGLVHLRQQRSVTNYEEFQPIFGADRQYFPLEEVTDLTLEEFMKQFSDPSQPQCIETPTEFWE